MVRQPMATVRGRPINAVREAADEALPEGYGYEFGGIAREEASTGNTTTVVFIICIVFIYLILCALYESLMIPFAVILSVPFGLVGSFIFAQLWGLENNIYMQTGLIMLIGLLSKTAILLTEYASAHRRQGTSAPHTHDLADHGVRYASADVRKRSGCQRKHIGRCWHGGRNAAGHCNPALRGTAAVHSVRISGGTLRAHSSTAKPKIED